tara:strand:- start:10981 stop:12027 length:1047 start_codon:yes stop_codon:yes gene_type:complete
MENNKPIILCLTDTHAHTGNLKLQKSIWIQAVNLAKELNIKKIVHLGDWVVDRKAQSLSVLEHLIWVKNLILENDLCLIGVSGNHDKQSLESTSAYPNLYSSDRFMIVEKTYELELSDTLSMWLMSYFLETTIAPEIIREMSSKVDTSKKNILGCHQGINGGLAHKNATSNKELPTGIFEKFDLVLSGHFHNKNLVEHDGSFDIWYIGSTHTANYGEDNDKGFTIIHDDGSIEFHNAEFPKFETIKIDVEEVDGKWLSETKKYIKETGINVRVIVTGDESELKKIKKQKFSDIGVKKLKLNAESVAIRNEDDRVVFVSLDKKAAIKEYKKFCVNNEIDPSLGLEYLDV